MIFQNIKNYLQSHTINPSLPVCQYRKLINLDFSELKKMTFRSIQSNPYFTGNGYLPKESFHQNKTKEVMRHLLRNRA